MKVLIGTRVDDDIINYKKALDSMGVDYDVSLDPKEPLEYDRLLIPGGTDVNPCFYGQENTESVDLDTELDRGQLELIRRFTEAGKPVFGICRGCQILNVFFGGTLIQDIKTGKKHYRTGDVDEIHSVVSKEESIVYNQFGKETVINSSHHQACDVPGKGILYTMYSEDGIVEAIEHESLPVFGVQWHPERTGFAFRKDGIADGEKLFRYFLGLKQK